MQKWYEQAKLGIFLHWGIYAVDGVAESWSFGSGSMSYEDYMKQLDGFTASNYNPEKWAKLIKQSGARYAILTTKHHDGVCLFDTAYTDLTVLRKTPAGRDLLGPYCEAMRKEGLKVGIYFTGTDWSDDDHMMALKEKDGVFRYVAGTDAGGAAGGGSGGPRRAQAGVEPFFGEIQGRDSRAVDELRED